MRRNKLQKLIFNKHNIKRLNKKNKGQKKYIVLFQRIYEESYTEFNIFFIFF
jgi:hypothetical protein